MRSYDSAPLLVKSLRPVSLGKRRSLPDATRKEPYTALFHNHHHWVTESGDTIFLTDADATAYPSGVPGLFSAIYPNGVNITGGTGRFAGAHGNIASWGAVDQNTGQIVLRYQGTIFFAPQH